MNKEVKRYDFGVVIDLLADMPSRKIRDRVSDVRDQAARAKFYSLDDTANKMYETDLALYLEGRYRHEPKFTSVRYHLLCAAKGLIVLTHRYNKVKWEVSTALAHGTKVAILKPFGKPDMVKPVSVADWELLCERESNPEWAAWMDELDINLQAVMNTATPWLDTKTLGELAGQFPDFDKFIDHLMAEIHAIEATGEWDIDVNSSVVYNEKASVSHYVANKGMDKGKRTCSSQYKYGKKQYWYNYEVLPIDIMTKYLHISFLANVDYKPLKRIVSDGVEYGTKIYTEFTEDETELGLTVTPLYEDPYFHKKIRLINKEVRGHVVTK